MANNICDQWSKSQKQWRSENFHQQNRKDRFACIFRLLLKKVKLKVKETYIIQNNGIKRDSKTLWLRGRKGNDK